MKKIWSLLIVAVMIFTQFASVFATDIDEPFIENINIVQDGSIDILNAAAGQLYEKVLTIKNIGNTYARSVVLSIDVADAPIIAEFTGSNILSNFNANKTADIPVKFTVKSTAPKGKYPIKFKMATVSGKGKNVDIVDIVINIQVVEAKIKPMLVIKNVTQVPTKIDGGKPFEVKFEVVNNGELTAKDVKVYLDGFKTDGFVPVDLTPYQYIDEIAAGSKKAFSFKVSSSTNIKDGMNTINIKTDYNDGANKDGYTDTNPLYITVNNPEGGISDDGTSGKPKIIVTNYSTNGALTAGSDFSFTFTAQNTSKNAELKNVKITVGSTDGTFSIKKGSGSFWIEKIKPQESVTKTINFTIKGDSLSKSSPLDVKFEYEYGKALEGTSSDLVSLAISEKTVLLINDVTAPYMVVNQQGFINFEVINMGKAELRNMTATLSGDFKPVTSMTYIGNFAAGKSDTFEIPAMADKEGELTGTLKLTYENSSGDKMEQTREFTASVQPPYVEPMEPENPGENLPEAPKGVSPYLFFGIELVLFLVTMLISRKVFIKRHEKKIEEEY